MSYVTLTSSGNLVKIAYGDSKVQYFDSGDVLSTLQINPITLFVSFVHRNFTLFDIPLSQISINGSTPTDVATFETAINSMFYYKLFGKISPYLAIGYLPTTTGQAVRRVTALGNNPDVDQGSLPEDVWTVGGVYPFPTAATSFEVVSTSASDTAAGTGARTVRIAGLDINYNEIAETVVMNGTTPVLMATQMFRINTALVLTAGSSETNVGTIDVNRSPGGITQAQISAGIGITRQGIYTVAAGHTLQIVSSFFAITRAGGVDKTVTIANFFRTSTGVRRAPFEVGISQSFPYRHDGEPGIPAAEKMDVGFRVVESSVSDVSVTAAFLGILTRNDIISTISYP